jgi:hypothetical protein
VGPGARERERDRQVGPGRGEKERQRFNLQFQKRVLPGLQKSPKFYQSKIKSSRTQCNNKSSKICYGLFTKIQTTLQFSNFPRILWLGLGIQKLHKNIHKSPFEI